MSRCIPFHASLALAGLLALAGGQAQAVMPPHAEAQAAQERLAASETKLAHVVDSNMVPMLFWTDTGVIEHANDALLDLFGYTRADITAGLTVEDLSLPESAELDARASPFWLIFAALAVDAWRARARAVLGVDAMS